MGLRGKIAVIFVALLVAAILAVSALEIAHVTRAMVSDLRDSGSILIEQTFEQIKPQLQRPNPYQELRSDITLHEFLDSSQAFGHGVVYLRIEDPAGTILAAVPPSSEGQKATQAPGFDQLDAAMAQWSPLSRARALWGAQTYEMSRAVEIGGRPFAVIKVGLSTGLIADEVLHSNRGNWRRRHRNKSNRADALWRGADAPRARAGQRGRTACLRSWRSEPAHRRS